VKDEVAALLPPPRDWLARTILAILNVLVPVNRLWEMDRLEFIEIERRSRVLTKAQFGCLKEVYTFNITRGCEFNCVYCYARGYTGAPSSGQVHLYGNLPDKLTGELDNPRRRSVVDWVVFNTASDSFQTHPAVLDITYRTMKVLLERGIGFSFLTKGWIPDRFIRLFSRYPEMVTARIGLVSLSPRYRDLFEPKTATPTERLQNIERLRKAGMRVDVRVDPIIPFYTDDEDAIKRLYQALAERDVRRVSISYLHLRPAILVQLQRELPAKEFNLLRSCFESQSWKVVGSSTQSKLIPLLLREKGYRRFITLSKDFGIKPYICACKNPDMPAHQCSPAVGRKQAQREETGQLSLFAC
jgi:DNA repair photolyase